MCRLAKVKKGDVIYDLGCGEGTALITAVQKFNATGVGIEIDPWRSWLARQKVNLLHLSNKLQILHCNFFSISITPASVVFIYLVPKAIEQLKKKMLIELQPGARVVCYRYPIPYLPLLAEDREKKIFVYTIPKKDSRKKK